MTENPTEIRVEPVAAGPRSDVLIGSGTSSPGLGQDLLRWAERNRRSLAVAGGVLFVLRVMRHRRRGRRRRAAQPD